MNMFCPPPPDLVKELAQLPAQERHKLTVAVHWVSVAMRARQTEFSVCAPIRSRDPERNAAILAEVVFGCDSLQTIGTRYGISRKRIQEIVGGAGYEYARSSRRNRG